MMKLTKTIFSTLFFLFFFFGKINSQCENTAIDFINANKIRATVLNRGDFFWNKNDGQFYAPFELGVSPPVSTIFAATINYGGIDNNGVVKTAWDGNNDPYISGPINDATLDIFDDGCDNFDYIWKISRNDILNLKQDFEDNGTINSPIPYAVKKWPAKGNAFFESIFGFELPDQELAPFFDRNNNGLYEPSNGEYPILDPAFPNSIPNEMTWSVYNNIAIPQNGVIGTGTEVHFMTYAFNYSEETPLNFAVFTRHKIINKSGENLSDFRIGIWLDADLGCFADDFFGCDTTLNALYIYNSDNDDNDPTCSGLGTYGENPPVQGISFLNQKMSTLTYYNNPDFNNPPIETTEPQNYIEFYNYLTGAWKDGTAMTFGGSGYDAVASAPIDHVFPDRPSDPNGWSMVTANLPHFDHRTVMSAGPFDFNNGDQIILDAVFSYHRHPDSDHIENVDIALSEIPSIQEFYNNGFSNDYTQVVGIDETFNAELLLSIQPNPNNGEFNLFFEETNVPSQINIFDFSGKNILLKNIPAHSDQLNIDLENELASGIYFTKWTLADGQFVTKKFIVK